MATVEPIQRSRNGLAVEVYERLIDALLRGSLGPGDRLIQDKLAEDLDVSRTPVRDALLRLHEEGVIEPSGRRGYVVRALSESDVRHLYEARYAIEGYAASVVAERGEVALSRIRATFEEVAKRKPRSSRQSYEANRAFHRAVVEAAGNPRLLDFFDVTWGRGVAGLVYHNFYVASPHQQFVRDHEALLREMAGGDGDRARRAMIDHIARGLARTPLERPRDVRSARVTRSPDALVQS
jgi:DNA-binding GntR family transcriptional regulator